jgi:hypothetical protein
MIMIIQTKIILVLYNASYAGEVYLYFLIKICYAYMWSLVSGNSEGWKSPTLRIRCGISALPIIAER